MATVEPGTTIARLRGIHDFASVNDPNDTVIDLRERLDEILGIVEDELGTEEAMLTFEVTVLIDKHTDLDVIGHQLAVDFEHVKTEQSVKTVDYIGA